MRIEVEAKSKHGRRPVQSSELENDIVTKISFSTDSKKDIVSISIEDQSLIVEIDDKFIIK